MLIIVVALAVCAALVVAIRFFGDRGTGRAVTADVDRFTAAREITSRWAADPSSAPGPVLDIARHGARPVSDEEPVDADVAG